MRIMHILAAVLVAFIWGTNFVAIKLSYETFTPFGFLFLRFVFSVFPIIFFIPKPTGSWWNIFLIAIFLWIGQFSFIFWGIYIGASPGLLALMMQAQNIFTLVLSVLFLHHRPSAGEVAGITIALAGIVLVGVMQASSGPSWTGLLLGIPGALCVAIANILLSKQRSSTDHPLSLIVWSSLIPLVPFLGMSLIFESPTALWESLHNLTWVSVASLLYTVYFSTLLATSLWAFLLKQYNPSLVVPFTLLIPVFSMGSTVLIFDEYYSPLSLMASAVILLGLGINQAFRRRLPKQATPKVS